MRNACALLILTLAAALAHAAEAPISAEAKKHVDAGIALYESGKYEEAIKEFELGYRLSNRPALLFNIARAEAKLGHDENAIAFLRRYLEERPDAPDATAVLAEIDARERAIANARGMQKAEAEAAAERAHAAELARKAAEDARRDEAQREAEARAAEQRRAQAAVVAPAGPSAGKLRARKIGYGLVAGGALVAVIGIVLGVLAENAASTVQHAAPGGPFTPSLQSTESNGQTFQSSGLALDVIGGAAAAAGVALIGWGFSR